MKPLYPALFLAAFAFGGCDKKKELDLPRMGSGDVSKEAGELKDALASTAAKERDAFMAEVGRERAELNARIETLKKEAAQAAGNARAELETKIARLEQEQKIADQTLVEMRTPGFDSSRLKISIFHPVPSTFKRVSSRIFRNCCNGTFLILETNSSII